MNPAEVIISKRNGNELSRENLQEFISGYLSDSIDSSQMSALLMAVYFKGMTVNETRDLTYLYINSGDRIKFSDEYLTADKHSTGGVGDKISLMLAPIAAACGLFVPMISGRGLGHTGGTLDKLESIPGFRTAFSQQDFATLVKRNGLAIVSQNDRLVPADRRIYALRDTTGTVESLPLITASIISKKVVEGAKNLVIDLKTGSGAFMEKLEDARKLGKLLQSTGEYFGQKVKIVYTNMNSPLGHYCGNTLEVIEAIEYLKGNTVHDIDVLTRRLAIEMLVLSGIEQSEKSAEEAITRVLENGSALDKFRQMLAAQKGNVKIIEDYTLLPKAKYELSIISPKSGYIKKVNSRQIGYALVGLGAGRRVLSDDLDMSAGAYLPFKAGDVIEKDCELGKVFCSNESKGNEAIKRITAAYEISSQKIEKEEIILSA